MFPARSFEPNARRSIVGPRAGTCDWIPVRGANLYLHPPAFLKLHVERVEHCTRRKSFRFPPWDDEPKWQQRDQSFHPLRFSKGSGVTLCPNYHRNGRRLKTNPACGRRRSEPLQ